METYPCGCDELQSAEKIDHEGNRAQRVAYARDLQRRYGCPAAPTPSRPMPRNRSGIDPRLIPTIERVERLTSCVPGSLHTCPLAYARTPDVSTANLYRNRRERRWLQQTAPDVLPARLVAQIEAIDRASDERMRFEMPKPKGEESK